MKKILLSGSSGFIGKALKKKLENQGFDVLILSRKLKPNALFFDFDRLPDNLTPFENLEAWIHLGGESIAGFRWTKSKKQKILNSRIFSNQGIKKLVNHLINPPKQIFIASGVGYYGCVQSEILDENNSKGDGFLADVAYQLEQVWTDSKISPILMRFATVLSFCGGALDKISLPWRLKLCPYYGNPNNYFPVITREELINMIIFLLGNTSVFGPVNFCSLKSYTQNDLFKKISQIFKPIISFTIPNFLIRFLLGQMGKETLLVNIKIFPRKLYELKYDFSDDKMFLQLAEELKKTENSD